MVGIKIMPLGDSHTIGLGDGRTPSTGWRRVLYDALTAAGWQSDFVGSQTASAWAEDQHEGHGGYSIEAIDTYVVDAGPDPFNPPATFPGIAAASPDVILLQIGTNDAIGLIADPIGHMRHLLVHIKAATPNADVLVSTIPPLNTTGYPSSAAYIAAFNTQLAAVVRWTWAEGMRLRMVNVGGLLTQGDLNADGVHPSAAGYSILAAGWLAALVPVLIERNDPRF